MTREEAVQRAREALEAWGRADSSIIHHSATVLADTLRDLLAVEVEPSEAVRAVKARAIRSREIATSWVHSATGVVHKLVAAQVVNDTADAIDVLPDTLAPVLTEDMVRDVRTLRDYCATLSGPDVLIRILAWFDEHFPPEPKHKPCAGCGAAPAVRSHGSTVHIGCSGGCGFRTESANMVAHAWDVWDRRTS